MYRLNIVTAYDNTISYIYACPFFFNNPSYDNVFKWSAVVKHHWNYSTARVFSKSPPRTSGVDFLAHRGSSWYSTPIPSATDFSPTAFQPNSLCKTTHLPVELYCGQSLSWRAQNERLVTSEWLTAPNFPSLHGEEIGTFILLMHHSADLPQNKYRNIST